MELTDENQDYMDCRPPTGRDTGIRLPPEMQKRFDDLAARRQAQLKARKHRLPPPAE